MSATVRIAQTFQPFTAGEKVVECSGSTVAEVLACVDGKHPGFSARILTADGTFHRYLQVFVNDDDARFLGGPDTPVADGDELSLFAVAAGG